MEEKVYTVSLTETQVSVLKLLALQGWRGIDDMDVKTEGALAIQALPEVPSYLGSVRVTK